jgi:hypothetical protein
MKLIVWNSQGHKWDDLWTNWMSHIISQNQQDDVLCLLAEAGWAPWVISDHVTDNGIYFYKPGVEESARWYNTDCQQKSEFCKQVQKYNLNAVWTPWAATVADDRDSDQRTNSRCSLGGCYQSHKLTWDLKVYRGKGDLGLIRPVLISSLYEKGNVQPYITVIMVHLVSSAKAKTEMAELVQATSEIADPPVLLVGDFNYDLLKKGNSLDFLGDGWSVINTGKATQQSGGELDYALLWDPNKKIKTKTATILAGYKTKTNNSDHSVMIYEIA